MLPQYICCSRIHYLLIVKVALGLVLNNCQFSEYINPLQITYKEKKKQQIGYIEKNIVSKHTVECVNACAVQETQYSIFNNYHLISKEATERQL